MFSRTFSYADGITLTISDVRSFGEAGLTWWQELICGSERMAFAARTGDDGYGLEVCFEGTDVWNDVTDSRHDFTWAAGLDLEAIAAGIARIEAEGYREHLRDEGIGNYQPEGGI